MSKLVYSDPLTPLQFLQRGSYVYANRIACVSGSTSLTYKQLYERVLRFASVLRKEGIEKGDKVAIISPNTNAMLEAHYAIPWISATMVPINIRLNASEIEYIINHSDAKILLVDSEFYPLIENIQSQLLNVKKIVIIRCGGKDVQTPDLEDYEEFLLRGDIEDIPISVTDEMEVLSINYTSGTTGRPKGAMLHHRGAYLNALGESLETEFHGDSVYLWTLPMFHCNGWNFPYTVCAVGGKQVCLRKVLMDDVFQLIIDQGVTHLCAAPTVLVSINEHALKNKTKFPRPITIVTAAAPPPASVIQAMMELGARIVHVYGLTEVYGPHTVCTWQEEWGNLPLEERAAKQARQGVPYIIAHYLDVVDNNGKSIPHDGSTIGEIVMRGNNVMLGYYKDTEATEKAFAGGWFHSGDLAIVYPDHYIQIVDRQKDIIISGGENISTVQIESVLYQHPDILEAAVIAIPDPKWGEVPKAFVTLKSGTTSKQEDIIAFCKQRIAAFKVPKAIEFCDLPKSSTGKVMKAKLREKEWSNEKLRVH